MKIRVLLILSALLVVAVVAAACGGGGGGATAPSSGGQAAAKSAGDAAHGKTVFTQTCASCHGPAGQGIQGLGKDFTTSAFVKSQTDQQLVDFVKKGRPATDPANTTKVDMPPKGGNNALTDKDLLDVVAFVRTLQK
ncbi:MAG: cytochrome c [Anaerolineae bacterium]